MKIQRKLNTILVILLIVLVSLISFGGIYYKNKNAMDNRVPNYILGADLTGYRRVVISPSETTDSTTDENSTDENTVSSDAENTADSQNNSVDDGNNTVANETETENEKDDTKSNYLKTAEIIRKRLKTLDVENFTVSCNEDTGKIEIDLPEDDRTDIILSDLTEIGKFEITDADTEEVLMDNSDVRSAKLTEETSSYYTTEVLNVNFNVKGTNKFKNITEKYQNTVTNDTSNETENSTDNSTSENTEETSESNENTTDSSKSTSSNSKVKISIDDSEILSTYFSEIVENGTLSLNIGYKSSMTDEQIYSAQNLCAIIENDPLPIEYTVEENAYIAPETDENEMYAIIYIEIAIALALALYMIAKYRIKGVMQTIINIGYVAVLLLVIRLANVYISTSGILAILISYVTSYIFGYILLKNIYKKDDLTKKEIAKMLKYVYRKYSLILIPILIISIVSSLTKWISLYSFGMILFWGIIISLIYNILLSKFLVKSNINEENKV